MRVMGSVVIDERVRIPSWVVDLESFRHWGYPPDFPECGRLSFLDEEIWVDVSHESVYCNQIKGAPAERLALMEERGFYFGDGMQLTNLQARFSTGPNGMFVSEDGLEAGRARFPDGDQSQEVVGTPEMVLEIVTAASVRKDTVLLPRLYWQAGVREYWLVDSRAKEPKLTILRHGRTKFTSARESGGWVKSAVFGKSFRLVREAGELGLSVFRLETR
jgi:hypothetical protein